MSTQYPGSNFVSRVKALDQAKKELDQKINNECERLMRKCGVPEVGSVVWDLLTGVRLKVTDRRMEKTPDSQNWSTYKFTAWLNGNPITKAGKIDSSTRTSIRHEFETP